MSGYVLHYEAHIFVFFIVRLYYFRKCKGRQGLKCQKTHSTTVTTYIHTHTNGFYWASGASKVHVPVVLLVLSRNTTNYQNILHSARYASPSVQTANSPSSFNTKMVFQWMWKQKSCIPLTIIPQCYHEQIVNSLHTHHLKRRHSRNPGTDDLSSQPTWMKYFTKIRGTVYNFSTYSTEKLHY